MLSPRITPTREVVALDGLWRFALDTATGPEPWKARLDTALEVPVPASYNDLFVDSSIRDHVGVVWYQRDARVPRGWNGERIVLRFGSVTHAAAVYVDDLLVAEHDGGYTPFEADLTNVLEAGREFRLTVAVDNRLTNLTIPPGSVTVGPDGRERQTYFHDFYNYAGIARSVKLYSTPTSYVDDITVVTGIDGTAGTVDYSVRTGGDEVAVRVRVLDESGTEVAVSAGSAGTIRLEDVRLWKPGSAYLYDALVELLDGDELVDSYTLPFGVRTVEVRGTEFLINGEPFYFTGFGKHEDTPIRGKGHDDAYLVHDFQLLEWTGANSFRTSHYPYAEEVLDFADRHGIVVVDETAAVGLNLGVQGGLTGIPPTPTFAEENFGGETKNVHVQHLRELIARDKNHPSVVMWSIANEPASNEDGAREYFEPLVSLARELDPTRPLTYAAVMFATPANDKIGDLFDVLSINRYYGWYVFTGDLATAETVLEQELRGWVQRFGKPIMMSEYGADTQPGLHSVWDMPWTEEYQTDLLAAYHRVFDRIPEFVGEHIWNFADFMTGPGIHRVDGNKKGVFTRDRKPKGAAFSLQSRWRGLDGRKPGSTD
ncbi:beta-glucuronidase [Leifsonia sp. 98AMF]|uniref:beta-glucuronidase n=1 Tax=unclassified Leifsonia TaxID=2663824 RepID=UPI00087C519D|nr:MULTISPECIES: beta-glucuronidase [unclassified Leifsonia]SDH60829.1 beta-glucuronidase [Leifsonia sp. 197AMF]SDI78311.1 beta-glucuronidase [Leifsonia sp. 466MF]SDK08029.1 beta-glucuronidase [Leifsonia sp. 157MF]SDN81769.1 beta-glucuronidase [Leifsonia sp. 509MF]SEN25576.1 beta-glucuronidase [Leifsonia sp. 467MF]